ncbi:hypothetical protein P9257_11490 [Bacillus velezensis]|uniref:hypothetical protein n=1 Tax=Bacillus velezensis TaxID=492670 RepID=UPI002E202D3F|nr:hypothetical protein [Bacillus velezensis]
MSNYEDMFYDYYEALVDDVDLLNIDFSKVPYIKILDESININLAVNLEELGLCDDRLNHHKINRYDFKVLNKRLNIWKNKGFHINDYCEFFINDNFTDIDFNIREHNVKVGRPSRIFQFLFNEVLGYKGVSDGWDDITTISINKIDIGSIDTIMERAIFELSHVEDRTTQLYYPEIYHFTEHPIVIEPYHANDEVLIKDYSKGEYEEVIRFYNEGRRKEEPLYFYRVLEYFFYINLKNQIFDHVGTYNKDGNEYFFMKNIQSIFTKKEETLLTHLLENLEIDQDIEFAYKENLIKENNKGIFIKALYEFRNSIVHSKFDFRTTINFPEYINRNGSSDNSWLYILESLAKKCIGKFC